MKILFVNRFIDDQGGTEHYMNALAARLKEKGHEVCIADEDKAETAYNEFKPDITYLHNLERGSIIDYFIEKVPTVKYIHDYKTVDPDGKMLLKNPLEVNRYPLSPACFLRAYTRICMPRSPVKGIKAYLRAKGLLRATKRLEKVIVASRYMKETLVNNGVKPEKISVLPYFIDYDSPQEVAEPDAKRMLYAGRIVDAKGLDVLLDVLTLVKEDFILDVAGTGPMEKICQDKVKNLGLTDKVAFHGWVERKGLAELYKKCSFLVLPSVWPEPFGICGIEAAFFGKPAVAFNVGGVSDWLIDGETGFLVEPYRKEEMAEKISYLLNNSEKVQELGREARKRAIEKYNPELHVKELLKILEK